jgi:antitoxin HigA-1
MSESDNSSSFSSEDDCQKPVKYFAGKSIPPGAIISQILIQKQMNLIEFSEKMNISQIEIKDILKGKKSITVDIATKLEKIFDMSADFWIEIEKNYQLNSALSEQKKVFEEEKNQLLNLPLSNLLNRIPIWQDGPIAGGRMPDETDGVKNSTHAIMQYYSKEWILAVYISQEWFYEKNPNIAIDEYQIKKWLILE